MTSSLRTALSRRVVVADGAMGTMLQASRVTMEDFAGLDGCNEILNVTRPDIVADIHRAYLAAGSDCVGTNTFGANVAALAEYDIPARVRELALAGARIARGVADEVSTPDRPRWVLGSMGPGTKLPTLRQISFGTLRDGYQECAEGLIEGGADAILIETSQDLLQVKGAVLGARRGLTALGADLPVIVSVTIETTGTMLLGTEIGAALTSIEPLGVDIIGLNCATGPDEMGEHLRHLSRYARVGLSCMPNAGLPELTSEGARYPLSPDGLATALDRYIAEFGLSLVGGCCGTTPAHIAALAAVARGRDVPSRDVPDGASVASLYAEVPLRQDTSYLSVGERTNANGSKAFREAMLAGDWDECVDIAKAQSREGAHVLDVCVDYVGRAGAADMDELASRLATAVPLPVMLDSTEPAVLRAGLEALAGRSIINSVNYEDGDGPGSRFARVMELVREHGAAVVALTIDEEGQARTAEWKLRVAERLIADLTGTYGLRPGDIIVDCLTFPIATGQEETRRDGMETIEAIRELKRRHPGVLTTLGLSNVSFGLNPAARIVLNSVFLHECVEAGLDSAIANAAKILPMARIPAEQREVALDLVYDRRTADYDPLARFLELFEGVTTAASRQARAEELAALPIGERLARRIVDGEAKGLPGDLDEALQHKSALDVINEDLLTGMKTVGELFGSGQMQLPFVLASAEVMKQAVRHLEPHLDRTDELGKGTIVLATVTGDVHDIGKNLVDIILANNGYNVVNIGIKQPLSNIVEAAEEHAADAIGMSGLLVKSTVVMRDNLAELNKRGLARYPVLLGGAALTRSYVEDDLHELYDGEVRYAQDAFEGLFLMDTLMAVKRGVPGAELPPLRGRRSKRTAPAKVEPARAGERSSHVRRDVTRPVPPFWGSRMVRGVPLADVAQWLDHKATFMGRWGLRPERGGRSYEELVETEGMPRLRALLHDVQTRGLAEFGVVYGYWPCYSDGDDLVVLDPETHRREVQRFTFPRQARDRRLCLADFFADEAETRELGHPDVIGLQLVTMGSRIGQATAELFAADRYRDYLELHGLSVQLTEALAELWHARIRRELGLEPDGPMLDMLTNQAYQGSRYSFGYPACPDLTDRAKLVALVDAARIGVELSPEFQLHPEQATDALVVHHPQARYFSA
ncbi:methionine synthase [Propionicicella superfundia]|uniref:methionine synthase n=1 Tax=Propionicicella superfundia TaxID=348582 RepID=UPI00041F522C|nr:methionine synthase [Propionicicella superfundia]